MSLGSLPGLGAAIAWGAGDFAGGLATRRADLFRVSVTAQALGFTLLLVAALVVGESFPDMRTWLYGAAAGLAGALGLGALYAALAAERMGVAAPITAVLSATIPVLYGALTLGLPSAVKLAGFALAIAGIWYLARPDAPRARIGRGIVLALASGVGFGFLLIFIGLAGEGGTWWPLVASRAVSTTAMVTVALVLGRAIAPQRSVLHLAVIAGTLDVVGNVLFIAATQLGRLDVAAVLASLYPASTVLLARIVLREKLTRTQMGGVVAALVAVVLIAGRW